MEIIKAAMNEADERGFIYNEKRLKDMEECIGMMQKLYPYATIKSEVVAHGFNTGTIEVKFDSPVLTITDIPSLEIATAKADDISINVAFGKACMIIRFFDVLTTK